MGNLTSLFCFFMGCIGCCLFIKRMIDEEDL